MPVVFGQVATPPLVQGRPLAVCMDPRRVHASCHGPTASAAGCSKFAKKFLSLACVRAHLWKQLACINAHSFTLRFGAEPGDERRCQESRQTALSRHKPSDFRETSLRCGAFQVLR